jgi:inner membrane protein
MSVSWAQPFPRTWKLRPSAASIFATRSDLKSASFEIGETLEVSASRSDSRLPAGTRRNLLVAMMAIGSNFPDLDFIYPEITGLKLDYLLHHRGHTHTVVGALLIAAVLFAGCQAWIRRRKLTPSPQDHRWLAGAALLAPLLHIAMDFGNSYGVHPFWPLWDGWLYGDSVFIVEPLFWASAAPLLFTMRTLLARVVVAIVLLAGVVLSFTTGMVPTAFAASLIAITAALILIGRHATARTAVLAGVGTWIAVVVVFAVSGRVAAHRIEIAAEGSRFGELLDHVLTPMPVNPMCWEVILVQADDDRYALRRAILSLAPAFIPADACPFRTPSDNITAPLQPPESVGDASIQWRGDVVLSRSELSRLVSTHCEISQLMRFARVPFYETREGPPLAGDLRFDREPEESFAEIMVGRDGCSSVVPPWVFPRGDLLMDTHAVQLPSS